MRIRQVDAINNGDVLTEAIMNEQKNVIIPAGTVLKMDYIPLIKSLGVDTVMIDDPYENYEHIPLSPKNPLTSMWQRFRL